MTHLQLELSRSPVYARHLITYLLFSSIFTCLFDARPVRADTCVDTFRSAQLTVFQPPVLSEPVRLCADDVRGETQKQKVSFYRTSSAPDIPLGTTAIVEIVAADREMVNILRDGPYLGEFADRILDAQGGTKSVEWLVLEKVAPEVITNALTVSKLPYLHGSETYQWNKDRIVLVSRKYAPVTLAADGKLTPRGSVKTSEGLRRLVTLKFSPAEIAEEGIVVQTSYFDPIMDDFRLFREFSTATAQHRTILQFIQLEGQISPAMIRFFRKGTQIGEVKVNDPGSDGLDIQIQLNTVSQQVSSSPGPAPQ